MKNLVLIAAMTLAGSTAFATAQTVFCELPDGKYNDSSIAVTLVPGKKPEVREVFVSSLSGETQKGRKIEGQEYPNVPNELEYHLGRNYTTEISVYVGVNGGKVSATLVKYDTDDATSQSTALICK